MQVMTSDRPEEAAKGGEPHSPIGRLSPGQIEVLLLVDLHHSSKEIANPIAIAPAANTAPLPGTRASNSSTVWSHDKPTEIKLTTSAPRYSFSNSSIECGRILAPPFFCRAG